MDAPADSVAVYVTAGIMAIGWGNAKAETAGVSEESEANTRNEFNAIVIIALFSIRKKQYFIYRTSHFLKLIR